MYTITDPKEEAFLYDLTVTPDWRERFDQIVDAEMPLPEKGKLLEVGCGTGSYAVDLALRAGHQTSVVALDESPARLVLAQGKAQVKKAERITFQPSPLDQLGVADQEFIWVVADATLAETSVLPALCRELWRVAQPGAVLGLKVVTRGSFDEFFSIYWETLYELDLLSAAPALETLITEQAMVADAEAIAQAAGWKNVRNITQKEQFSFADGEAFLADPLFLAYFLPEWLAILPTSENRERVKTILPQVIERASEGLAYELSVKATLVLGQK